MRIEVKRSREDVAGCVTHQRRSHVRRTRKLRAFNRVVRAIGKVRSTGAVCNFSIGWNVVEAARCAIKHLLGRTNTRCFLFTLVRPKPRVCKGNPRLFRASFRCGHKVHGDQREVLHRSPRKEQHFPVGTNAGACANTCKCIRQDSVVGRTAVAQLQKAHAAAVKVGDLVAELRQDALWHARRTGREVVDAAKAGSSGWFWMTHGGGCCRHGIEVRSYGGHSWCRRGGITTKKRKAPDHSDVLGHRGEACHQINGGGNLYLDKRKSAPAPIMESQEW